MISPPVLTCFLYSQVERSRSATPYNPDPWQPDDLEEQEKDSHDALVKDNGRPCYPIELGLDVFDNPGQYKEILKYWQDKDSSEKMVFTMQVRDWEMIRRKQQHNRRYYISRNRFHEYQETLLQRRRSHGLDGDPQLHENVAEQSKLDDWMEYQHYKLGGYEALKIRLKEVQEELASRRKLLAEAGYSAWEEIEELEFGQYLGMTFEWREKHAKAEGNKELAERKFSMAKKRLEAAQSQELGEKVERDRWIDVFVEELESQRTRLDELQRLADEAKRDAEPYNQWWDAKINEWEAKGWDEFTEEGRRLIKLEASSLEYRTRREKKVELQQRAAKARHAHFRAEGDVEFAEELLEAARTEDLAQTVERAALIRRTEKEVRFAEFHVEEAKESIKRPDLKWQVLDSLHSVRIVKMKMERHNILLDWVERQRQELVGDSARTGQRSGLRRSTRLSSGAHLSPGAIKASSVAHPAKRCTRSQKPLTGTSILHPVNPAKVTKTRKQKGRARQRVDVPRNTSPAAEKTGVDSSFTKPANKAAVPVKDGLHAHLNRVRSSRVSKPAPKKSIAPRKGDMNCHRQRTGVGAPGKHRPGTSSTSSKKVVGRLIDSLS